jgi:FkbM family methyltransferase
MIPEMKPSFTEKVITTLLKSYRKYRNLSKVCYNPYSLILWKIGLTPSLTLRFKDKSIVVIHTTDEYDHFWDSLIVFQRSIKPLDPEINKDTIVIKKEKLNLDRDLTFFYDSEYLLKTSLGMLKEQFLDNQYSKLNFKGKVVVDLGASIADTAIYFAVNGAKQVIAFEPYPYSYKVAMKNVELNKLNGKIQLVNAAVSENVNKSILIDPNFQNAPTTTLQTFNHGVLINNYTLKDIVDSWNLKDACLKIDVEGGEYKIIESCETNTLQAFSEIMLEYHGTTIPLKKKLKKAGFSIKDNHLGLLYAKRIAN